MAELTDWETGPRLLLNFIFLFIANCGLISLHQMAGQFGVLGNDTDVLVDNDEDDENTKSNKPYSPPEIEMMSGTNKEDNDCSSETSKSTEMYPTQDKAPVVMQLLAMSGITRVDSRNTRLFPLFRTLKRRGRPSMSDKHKRQVKILLTFIFVTMFWSVVWDLFGSLPKEQLIEDDDENGNNLNAPH